MTAIQSFRPEPGFEEESLISTAKGAEEGQTLMYVGIADLKREYRAYAYGSIEEDPLSARQFYWPTGGWLAPVSVSRVDEVVSADTTTAVFEVRHIVPTAEGHRHRVCTFEIVLRHD